MVPMSHSLQLLLASSLVTLGAVACAGQEEFSPYGVAQYVVVTPEGEDSEDAEIEGEPEGSQCQEGQVIDCQITHELASGTLYCVKGLQFCNDGYWSECYGG